MELICSVAQGIVVSPCATDVIFLEPWEKTAKNGWGTFGPFLLGELNQLVHKLPETKGHLSLRSVFFSVELQP